MVADGLPPDAGCGLLHAAHTLADTAYVHSVLQLMAGLAVPALHQVDSVQHEQEGQGDVDIAVGAGAVMVHEAVALIGAAEGEAGHRGDVAPGHGSQAAVHEQGEQQALPVGLPAEGLGERGLDGTLLLRGTGRGAEMRRKQDSGRTQNRDGCRDGGAEASIRDDRQRPAGIWREQVRPRGEPRTRDKHRSDPE